MTVSELIAELQKMPGDAEVTLATNDGDDNVFSARRIYKVLPTGNGCAILDGGFITSEVTDGGKTNR